MAATVFCGFSMALGAFVMGSILAGTSYAERIENVTMPVKDLFGSVFFISVGMMVQPDIILQYWWPILLLSVVVIVGMIIFGTFGMLVTGQPLKIAIQSGFSLTQIGEFAFIIATLGMSLGVLNPEIYPIVVAVSVITTFTTPYFIRLADPAYARVEKRLPERLRFLIDRYTTQVNDTGEEGSQRRAWTALIKRYLWRIALYSIIIVGISVVSHRYLMPELEKLTPEWCRLIGSVATLLMMAPFLLALCLPPAMNRDNTLAHLTAQQLKAPRIVMMIFRLLLALWFIVRELWQFYSIKVGLLIGIACLIILFMLMSKRLNKQLRHIEAKFLDNLNERELRRSGKKNNLVSDLHLAYMHVGYGCPFVGERLANSGLRRKYGINVVTIQRGMNLKVVPSGDNRLFPGDTIGVIGTDDQIAEILPVIEAEAPTPAVQPELTDFKLTSVVLSKKSPLIGQTLAGADVRRNYQTHVVTLERDGEFFDHAPDLPLREGDRLWIVGTPQTAAQLR